MVLNSAFLFIKAEAHTAEVKELVEPLMKEKGLRIVKKGELKAEVIDKKQLIDNHYYAIASKATILKPKELNVPNDKFKGKFGLDWQAALDAGKVFNALDGCEYFGVDAEGMAGLWAVGKKADKLVKFGGGFYCGDIEHGGKRAYIFNGFFMDMRAGYVKPGKSIFYYVVQWDSKKLSWGDFRTKVCGATDPEQADPGSMRGQIFAKWEDLKLAAKPDVGNNGMHASASPFEGLSERMNWLGYKCEKDAYGEKCLNLGIPMKVLKEWCRDPQVVLDQSGKKGSCYDSMEDLDAQPCLDKMSELWTLNRERPTGKVSGVEYDFFNEYANILAGKTECHKVFENANVLAFLDGATGHVVVISKVVGFPTMLDMPGPKATDLMKEVPRLAKAVKEAMGAKFVNMTTHRGVKDEVFHPNMHIVAEGAKKLSADAAKDLLGKIDLALHPPTPLKHAKFHQVGKIRPEATGLNLSVKAIGDTVAKEVKPGTMVHEVQVADATGAVTISLSADQKDVIKKGKTYELRNCSTRMIKGHIMIVVDKWGKIAAVEAEIEPSTEKDISAVEYEQVKS